ncbi:hypothetical protein [Donghicola mangrovi]|uniref:Uncharacterized protein n=1 Tax=Donghicola mangrovi TaxID=2729614 RepID=A0A850Q2T0_9RHOB|nr:hypothetical protein [Donghicola mangrovi]NVO23406.1 hypothetical protein [Donghicola mangrovi]
MLKKTWIVASVALLGLAACGDTLGEQALLGGGAGAAAGAVTGGDVVTGAVVGAAGNVAYCRTYPSRCN